MEISKTLLKNAYVIQTEPFEDRRGEFSRIFCRKMFQGLGYNKEIVQINRSLTRHKGALRGMHFQYPPRAELKVVLCLRGSVFDVMIDLRQGSSTFLKWHGEVLSEENKKMMYIPEGFAHGFQSMEKNSELLYLHTEFYSPGHESGVRYNDPMINITWPFEVTEVSEKDQKYPLLSEEFEGIILK
jgi:dTDP-4-dehydrorhamnose 3,5-epimerase